MQNVPLNKNALFSILGTNLGGKLLVMLNDCCKPNIALAFTATCAGTDPKSGNPTYNVTASATYNINLQGYTTLIGYFSSQPFPNWTSVTSDTLNNLNLKEGTIFVGNITANVPVVFANLTGVKLTAGNYYFMVTDNRSNYATPLTVTVPNCGASPKDSTPASQKTTATG